MSYIKPSSVTRVISTLRGGVSGLDMNATYNAQDTVGNNPIKGTGPYIPDIMDKVQMMRI